MVLKFSRGDKCLLCPMKVDIYVCRGDYRRGGLLRCLSCDHFFSHTASCYYIKLYYKVLYAHVLYMDQDRL